LPCRSCEAAKPGGHLERPKYFELIQIKTRSNRLVLHVLADPREEWSCALKRGGLLCAYGYIAGVQAQRRLFDILMWIARLYRKRWFGGRRARFYSINVMRARHPAWFREDLERLFGLLATGAIRPRVAGRISFDEISEAHRRVEEGGLEGKLVLCPDLPSRRDRAPPQRVFSLSETK
jgi:hypothetical protein